MNEYETPKDFLEENIWYGGVTISILIFISICIYIFISNHPKLDETNMILEEMNGPSSVERYHAPRGMNGPSEKQVIGRGR